MWLVWKINEICDFWPVILTNVTLVNNLSNMIFCQINQERYIFGDDKQQCSWMGNVETCEYQYDLEHY
jgi:hypothetical protein